jgi:hypothetical protein
MLVSGDNLALNLGSIEMEADELRMEHTLAKATLKFRES